MCDKCPLLPANPQACNHAQRRRVPRFTATVIFKFVMLQAIIVTLWWCLYLVGSTVWARRHGQIEVDAKNLLESDITGLTQGSSSTRKRAQTLLKQNPLIDGHNDLMLITRKLYEDRIFTSNFSEKFENGGLEYHTDIPRLKEGLSSGAFWVAWVTCPAWDADFSDETYEPIVKATLEQLDLFHRLGAAFPDYFTPTLSSAAAQRAVSENRFIAPLSIEGLHQIGNSVATLRTYFDLGVRYATLTWNCHNIYADAALATDQYGRTVAAEPHWGGLTAAGRALVEEMNRLGMMVDLAHVSADVMRDVLGGTEDADGSWGGSLAPPFFSHSSAHAICPHPRNVPDDVLQLVARRRSVVLVNFNEDFISCAEPVDPETRLPVTYAPNVTLAQVVWHIKYIGDLIGYDYVGIGSDFDGIKGPPRGLEDVSKFPELVAALLEEGIAEDDVVRIMGGNLLRVWGEVDRVAAELQKGRVPLEDGVSDFNGSDPTLVQTGIERVELLRR